MSLEAKKDTSSLNNNVAAAGTSTSTAAAGGANSSSSNGSSHTNNSSSSNPKAVSSLRKQELLLEARRNRVEWVDSASSAHKVSPNNDSHFYDTTASFLDFFGINGSKDKDEEKGNDDDDHDESGDGDSGEDSCHPDPTSPPSTSTTTSCDNSNIDNDGLTLLRTSRACASMKSSLHVVSSLYRDLPPRQIEERVARQLISQVPSNEARGILSNWQKLKQPHIQKSDNIMDDKESSRNQSTLTAIRKSCTGYEIFIQRLRSPEAADVVHGLKHFCTTWQGNPKDDDDYEDEMENSGVSGFDASAAADAIHGYLDKTLSDLQTHVLWQNDSPAEFEVQAKMAMETFLFQKLHDTCYRLTQDEDGDEEVRDKIQSLQFVSWEHLDIKCLSSITTHDHDDNDNKSPIPQSAWSIPLDALRSISSQWSPTSKLLLIMEAYRGVSNALTKTMPPNMYPGADDILPSLILALLHSQPEKAVSDLAFIQSFTKPALLRGEPGYVLTNLWSAVQFIRDVTDETSLTITTEDFAKGLDRCKKDILKRQHEDQQMKQKQQEYDYGSSSPSPVAKTALLSSSSSTHKICVAPLSATQVRNARLRGEELTLEWALQRQAEKHQQQPNNRINQPSSTPTTSPPSPQSSSTLPDGFTRTYSFLGMQPDDVRISDVPKLLSEYHQLVRACENLLQEKSTQLQKEQKRKLRLTRERLESDAKAVEIGVVPFLQKSKVNHQQISEEEDVGVVGNKEDQEVSD